MTHGIDLRGMTMAEATGSECLSSYTSCDKHRNEQIVKFCDTHNALICRLCEVTGHKTCGKVTIKDKSKQTNQKTSIGKLLKTFQSLETDIDTLKSKKTTNKRTLLSKLQECHEKVQTTRKGIDEHFDKLDKSITDSLRQLEQELLATEESQIKACEHSIQEIEKEIKQLKACESTGDDEIMFVGRTKYSPALEQFVQSYKSLKTDTVPRYPSVLIHSEINELFRVMKEMGKVGEHMDVDLESDWTPGSTFLPDGRFVVSSMDPPRLFLYAADGNILSSIGRDRERVHGVCAISDKLMVCTVPDKREIHFIDIDDKALHFQRKIKTDSPCYGIAVLHDIMYVTCHGGGTHSGDGEVSVLTMDGRPVERFNSRTGCSFTRPADIFVDEITSAVYVIDEDTRVMTIIAEQGKQISQIKLEQTFVPKGICRGEQDVCIVAHQCGILFLNGTSVASNLVVPRGYPMTVSYRKEDGALFVGGYGTNVAMIYWFK